MYYKESFDKTNQQGFDGRRGDCSANFRARFGEAFAGGFPWADRMRRHMSGRKSVNIADTGASYILSLYAAGLKKELFQITVNEDVLTISYQPQANEASDNFIHKEYQPSDFRRSFLLNGKVLTDQITASYTDGVLQVTLPKNPEAHQPGQEIKVA